MKKIALVSLVLLMFGFTAMAAEFAAPENKNDANLSFSSGETHKNLYAAGGSVTVNSDITGDLYVAGGMITVTGKVEKDLVVAGGNINLNGVVGDDLRIMGGNISVNSPIAGDLLAAGGNIGVSEKSSVGGDVVIGSGNVILDSPVMGSVKIGGGNVTINSKVFGDVEVVASKGLTFGPKSEIMGKIIYKGPQEAVVDSGAKITPIQYTKTVPDNFGRKLAGFLTLLTLLKLLALFLAAWVLNRLIPGRFPELVNEAYMKPWHNLGLGLVAFIATPIIAMLLMITLIGFYLGLVLMLIYILMLLTTAFATLYFMGSLVVAWVKKSSTLVLTWQTLVYGVLISALLKMIPILGTLVAAVAFLMVMGTVVMHAKRESSRPMVR